LPTLPYPHPRLPFHTSAGFVYTLHRKIRVSGDIRTPVVHRKGRRSNEGEIGECFDFRVTVGARRVYPFECNP
jgi:hypothetical protein